jgi:hypothetical protein
MMVESIIEDTILENDRNIARQDSNTPKLGDILAVNCGLYYHYGVYAGTNRVIHYAAKNANFGDAIYIHETTLHRFLHRGRCLICRFPDKYRKPDLGTKISKMIQQPNLFTVLDSVSALLTELSSSEFHLYSGKETADRARSRLGEDKYNLIFNNCEHFAVWCKTGISESSQVSSVLSLLAAVPIGIMEA